MASFTGKANGNWTSGGQTVWNEDYGGGHDTPVAGDTVDLNGKTIVMDVAALPVGGGALTSLTSPGTAGSLTVNLATLGDCSINATTITAGTTAALISVSGAAPAATLSVTGNVTGGSGAAGYGIYNNSTGTVAIVGDVLGGGNATAYGVRNQITGTVTIAGSVTGSANATGAYNASTGTITVTTGPVTGGSGSLAYGINNNSTGTVAVVGDVSGGTYANGIYSNGTLNVAGDVTGGSGSVARGIYHNATSATCAITGNVLGGTNATAYGVYNVSTGTVTIDGSVTGSANATGAYNSSTGTITVTTGPVTGGSAAAVVGVRNAAAGTINATCNVVGGSNATAYGITNSTTGPVNIAGDCTKATANPILNSSTGLITLLGTGNQTVNFGGAMSPVVVTKITSGVVTFTSGDTITFGAECLMASMPVNGGATYVNSGYLRPAPWPADNCQRLTRPMCLGSAA